MSDRRRSLPDLGPRGEGWVAAQFVLLGLIVVLGLLGAADALPTSVAEWLLAVIGATELLIGGIWLARAFRELGPNLTPLPRPTEHGVLVRSGIYATVRHPIYAGLILGAVGWATLVRSGAALGACVLLAVLLDAKSRREEQWLLAKFPDYAAYRSRSRRFLRGIY